MKITRDPIAPEIVLLGLILVNLGPLKIFPNTKPPISDATQVNKIMKKLIFSDVKKKKNKKICTKGKRYKL